MDRDTVASLPEWVEHGDARVAAGKTTTAGARADFYAWATKQSGLLRSGQLAQAGIIGIADEIDDVGESECAALQSDLTIIALHMLKWDFQPSRRATRLNEAITECYEDGRARASAETGLADAAIPDVSPNAWDDIMERPFSSEPE